jgi:hypothetical protein
MIKQDKASWDAGYHAGIQGGIKTPGQGVDAFAYYSGYIEGKADKDKHLVSVRTKEVIRWAYQ